MLRAMQVESATRERFLRSLAAWTIAFWAAVYALLTARSLLIRPDLPLLDLAGLRALMIPVGLLVCAFLFMLLERVLPMQGRRKAAALAAILAVATLFYFTVNYYVFHRFPEQPAPEFGALVKVASYLVEFFWIFPAWVLLYLVLRRRAAGSRQLRESGSPDGIWVRDRGSRIFVRSDSIRWVESEGDYARIHTVGGSHLVRSTMAALERELAPFGLLRIHRRVIAPVRAVKAVGRLRNGPLQVTLDHGLKLPVGRRFLPNLNRALAEVMGADPDER